MRVLIGSHFEPLVPYINQVVNRVLASVGYPKQVALDELVAVSEAGIISFPCLGCVFPYVLHISSIKLYRKTVTFRDCMEM